MSSVIKVENLSKKYIIGHQKQERYTALRDILAEGAKRISHKLIHPFAVPESDPSHEEFWALKDVSFDIQQGDRVGIIGRNGAGKSTLLKILSRITEPTSGRVTIKGRVASLLEVGTGFHPELTGRENIFLNGAILGMSKVEIKKQFDEIVAFAEVEKFLDTPVKRYSSGMYVRLAFSVAAHLEPEVLIVDEVLAVGDSMFQKKCIDKMTEVSKEGRTILFVSHNLAAIKALCTNAIILADGKMKLGGNVQEVLNAYILGESQLSGKEINLSNIIRHGYLNELKFKKITFLEYPIVFGKPIEFRLKLECSGIKTTFSDIDFGIAIRDENNNTLIHCSNRFINKQFKHTSDEAEYLFEIENILKPGMYYLTFFLRSNNEIQDWISNAIKIEIEDGNPYDYMDTNQIQGAILPHFDINSTIVT